MISGDHIRAAREAAGLTQQQLANALGVTLRTVGNWERGESVPRNREAKIRSILANHLPGFSQDSISLERATDMELLAELAKRLTRPKASAQKAADADRSDKDDYRLAARQADEQIAYDQMPEDT